MSITGTGSAASSSTLNIKQLTLPDNTLKKFTYDSVLAYSGFFNVRYSAYRPDSVIAHGNIDKN